MKCWGDNQRGQLGIGNTVNQATPVSVPGLESGVIAIDSGGNRTCAVLADGTAKCWGHNSLGQLGNGNTTAQYAPVAVANLTNAVEIAAGGNHT